MSHSSADGADIGHPLTGSRHRSLAHELEDGPLRRELNLPDRAAAAAPSPSAFEARLAFDGSGSEYFRIWVVNVLLTLLTLGVYSAWAKVRKARWFAQHTQLMGDRFDYHGEPWRVLAGRVLAVGLLLLWTWSFDIAAWVGWTVLALMLLVGPLLFASAQRFRLANTSWRGLRFGFEAPRRQVYAVCAPLLVMWAFDRVLAALELPENWLLGALGLVLLALPLAHAHLKRVQHQHARFGTQAFSFQPAQRAFYGLYAKAAGLFVAASAATFAVGVLIAIGVASLAGDAEALSNGMLFNPWAVLATLSSMLLLWLSVWPYFAARTQQIVWSHTQCGPVRFRGEMQPRALWRLALRQTLWTVLTAGLYWPFAAVAIARYRIESMVLQADTPIGSLTAAAPARGAREATGDAAADTFGLDLGW